MSNSLENIFDKALSAIDVAEKYDFNFETPKNPEHGDISTNIALRLAKPLKNSPRNIAQMIIDKLEIPDELTEFIQIAGPGFINVKFSDKYWIEQFRQISKNGSDIGKSALGKGKKVNVEYVSVNPTGLLHLGHGRNACIGDTVANLLEWTGYNVTREYYFNNAGSQMQKLAKSIYARYMQFEKPDFPFPEDGYHGEYIIDIAREIKDKFGKDLADGNYQDMTQIRKYGETWCFEKINITLKRMAIKQNIFFNEESLYSDGKIKEVINELTDLGLTYEKEGAKWLALSKMGLKDDRVIVKSSGEPTYRLPDIAYHRDKFQRGYDLIVDVFGADHIATVPDVLAACKMLGFDTDKVQVLVHQFVTLTEGGEQVKMSKRSGKSYTLDDLLDEVGEDVVRFFLLMRNISTHLEFDLELAREQSEKNPVFYLQYAHARICSVFDKAADMSIKLQNDTNFDFLNSKYEIDLIKSINGFPEAVANAAQKFEPQILAEYLRKIASDFHVFYHNCPILSEEDSLRQARLKLADVTRTCMKNGLTILGISAPERM